MLTNNGNGSPDTHRLMADKTPALANRAPEEAELPLAVRACLPADFGRCDSVRSRPALRGRVEPRLLHQADGRPDQSSPCIPSAARPRSTSSCPAPYRRRWKALSTRRVRRLHQALAGRHRRAGESGPVAGRNRDARDRPAADAGPGRRGAGAGQSEPRGKPRPRVTTASSRATPSRSRMSTPRTRARAVQEANLAAAPGKRPRAGTNGGLQGGQGTRSTA